MDPLCVLPGTVALIVRRCVGFYQPAVPADGDRRHRDDNTRQVHGRFKYPGKSPAAGSIHDQDGDAFEIGFFENTGEFFDVLLPVVEFRAPDEDGLPLEIFLVKAAAGRYTETAAIAFFLIDGSIFMESPYREAPPCGRGASLKSKRNVFHRESRCLEGAFRGRKEPCMTRATFSTGACLPVGTTLAGRGGWRLSVASRDGPFSLTPAGDFPILNEPFRQDAGTAVLKVPER